ncbi:hypothetical protein GOBAR_DD08703 [Gossypium barbadense]|nr:hypothetical protein GOBAR_DD08703 [Gossypium barbadense]
MVKTRNFVDGDSSLATKVVWDDELTLIFYELCVNEVNAGNRPTNHLNSKGWENVIALFQAKTQKNYGKPQLKNKWDTLKKEWRLWRELLKESTGIGWCPSKKTVDATEEWWAAKIQLMWQMFGGIVATGENAWAPSSGVLPSGVPMGDDAPNEGFGDSDEHSNENEGIPPDEVPSNPFHEIPDRRKQTLGVAHDPDDRVWWLRREYAEQNPIASFSSLVMDEFNNMYNSFYMNYDTSELSEEAQRRIATIVTQVEHNNYHNEEEYVLSSVLVHHETYFTMQPRMDSNYTGQIWVDEVLNGHDDRCMISFRMPKNIFHRLCFDMNYDTSELSEEVQRRIATIVTQVEHNNYHNEEEYVLSSVLVHHETYFTMQPRMDSNYTGQIWVDEVLNGHDDRCMISFRMPKNIFHRLLHDLQTNYGLKNGKVSAMEKLALSLYILGNRESNSNATERFQRSGETVSRIFTDMLHIFARMGIDTIKPIEGQFEEVPNRIRHDTIYWSHFKVLLIVQVAVAQTSNDERRQRHSEGYCAMYDICGERSDGKVVNCPYGSPAVKLTVSQDMNYIPWANLHKTLEKPVTKYNCNYLTFTSYYASQPDELLSSKIQSLCPTITGNVCCTKAQFDTLQSQVQQAIPFLVGCPACLRNFLNLFCELTCSPNQSLFINVTSISKIKNNSTVDGIDFFITDDFGEGLYESCKDVKFGTMNTRALEFIGAGAKNFKEWFAFIGRRAPNNMPGSPYAIQFLPTVPESSGMKPMNVSTYSCRDVSLGCSCGDCPSSPVCSNTAISTSNKAATCSVQIGSLKAKCVDLALAILYIVLVSMFFGWGVFHRTRKRSRSFRMKPFTDAAEGGESHSLSRQKADNLPMQRLEDANQSSTGVQLSVVQGYMSDFYRKYGLWVARHPTLVLSLSVGMVLVLCLGLVRFKVETRPEKLWVGPGSKAAEEKRFFDSNLAPFYRIEQLILATIPDVLNGKSPSIVTEENIKLLFEIQKKIDGIRANYSGSMISLTDICMKPMGEDCATQSVIQYFKMDPNYDADDRLEHVNYCFQHYTSAESCMSAFKAPVDPSTVLGGFSGSNYTEASAFIVTYPVNNALDKEGNETQKAVAWEKAFVQLAKDELLPMVQSRNLTFSFSSESSIEEELKRESTADAITILISYLVMFAYISLTLGDTPRLSSFYISSKVLLGLSGVLLVMLSVLGSVGFFSAIGVKSTLIIMEVIPFLVLAVGVDNMCILVHSVKRQPLDLPLEGRISNALVEVGPSITLASLSEVFVFAVGSFIPMPACRVFSMFAALAVLLDFLLQVTAFVSLIVFDFLRAEGRRVDCFPCIKASSTYAESEKGIGGRKPGLLARYMKEVHAPILNLWGVKIIVVAVFVAFALASIALSTRIEPGLEQKIVLPQDSYLQGYFNNVSEYLRIGPPLYFVVKNYNYSSESIDTNKLCSISQCNSDSLLNEKHLVAVGNLLMGVIVPLDDQPPCCSPNDTACGLSEVCKDCTTCFRHSDLHNDRPSTAQFRDKLPWFLDALPSADCSKGGHGAYTSSVELTGYESGIIKASSFRTYHTPLNKQIDYVNSMRAARKFASRVSDSLKMEIFPYSVFYMFFEQYLDIWKTALINLAIAIGAGVIAILGIQLNAVSVVNLVMSVGIAVEFCVHITHAFSVSSGNRNERVKEALGTMGASVFSGITLTKLVGVLVYYFQMYLALVLLGFLHGLVFLPAVVLSMVGPLSRCIQVEKQDERPSVSSQP